MTPSAPLVVALADARSRSAAFLKRHPRAIAASVSVALAGCAATAFGVAPLVSELPDANLLPRTTVTVEAPTLDLQAQLEALAGHTDQFFRSDFTRAGDTADTLLARLGVADPAAAEFLRSDASARKLLDGKPGKRVQARVDASGRVEELIARYAAPVKAGADKFPTHFTRLRIERVGAQLVAYTTVAPLTARPLLASGTIRSSLFAATDAADIPDAIAVQIAEMFGNDIDFHRELRKGATFSVVYEALTADGEAITWGPSTGRVLAAEFVNGKDTYSSMWYQEEGRKGAWFDLDGQSKQRAFLASPLEFSRVTSGFAMRMHPIHGTWRQHNGVDYGAPSGTAVRTVGDGTVEFAGWQNGYGNVVHIKHANERTTLYAHLSRVDVKRGDKVEQGETIGAVGQTGWATGPHLHFEVKIGGQLQDPLEVAQTSEAVVLSPQAKAALLARSQSVRTQLAVAQTLSRAQGLGE